MVRAYPDLAQARLLLGICLFESGELVAAIEHLEAIYRTQPGNVAIAYTLASAYLKSARFEKVAEMIETVFRDPVTAEARVIRGGYAVSQKRADLALEELRAAVRLNPTLPTAHAQLGGAWLLLGNREEAVAGYEAELRVNPENYDAVSRLGWLYREDGRLAEAEPLLRRALAIKPGDPGLLYQLGRLLTSQGQSSTALPLIEQLVSLVPEYRPARVLLARVYFRLQRNSEARREQGILARLTAEQLKRDRSINPNRPVDQLLPDATDRERPQ